MYHYADYKTILAPNNGMNIYRGCTHNCIYCDSVKFLHKIPDARRENQLVFIAGHIFHDVFADSLAVGHFAENPAVGAEYALNGIQRRIWVIIRVHGRIAVCIAVLRSDLPVLHKAV